ncbi:MAG: TetR/AcrR family transcriptional regulator [Pseudomonadota bacterium]
MPTSARAYHHGDLCASVLRAAGRLLEKQGVEGLRVRELARRAKVSHNAPYRHFADRDALLAALAVQGFEELDAWLRQAAGAGGLRAMGEAYVRFALERPQRFRLMFGRRLARAKHARLRAASRELFGRLAGALAARVPGAQDARPASLAAWALAHGLALLLLEDCIAGEAAGAGRAGLVRAVLGSVRFALGAPQDSA